MHWRQIRQFVMFSQSIYQSQLLYSIGPLLLGFTEHLSCLLPNGLTHHLANLIIAPIKWIDFIFLYWVLSDAPPNVELILLLYINNAERAAIILNGVKKKLME